MKTLWIGLFFLIWSASTSAARIKDIASVGGVRENTLIGYGLVVGLPGTGERTPFTDETFVSMLKNFGVSLPNGKSPKIKNVAAVVVQAKLPAFAKQGQKIDVTVSSVGSAKSLRGGTLLQTFLKGLDGKVYAIAQGSLVLSGFSAEGKDGSKLVSNTPTVGRIFNGAMVENEVPNPFSRGNSLTFHLFESDFSTAQNMVDAINRFLGSNMAHALDATSVRVQAPKEVSHRVAFLSALENLTVEVADAAAKIIVNARTGTIVIGQNVRLKPAAITHGSLTVSIDESPMVSQPNPFANGETTLIENSEIDVTEGKNPMFAFEPGVTLSDLVAAVNAVGTAPSDLMAILSALKEAGAIEGQLIVL